MQNFRKDTSLLHFMNYVERLLEKTYEVQNVLCLVTLKPLCLKQTVDFIRFYFLHNDRSVFFIIGKRILLGGKRRKSMRVLFTTIFLLLITTSFLPVCKNEKEWVLKKEVDGIKVYVRPANNSKLKELKLLTTMDAKMNTVVSYLSDKDNYHNWVYGCVESYLLKKISDHEVYHYQRTSPPWPMSDRDLVVRSIVRQDSISKVVYISANDVSNYMKENDGIVRVPKFIASWKITRLSSTKVELEHQVSLDPGGDVPGWILNLAISEGPVKSMKKFKSDLPTYKKNLVPFIKD